MDNIKVIIADVDGTLITRGKFESVPAELSRKIRDVRSNGVLFSFASGRDRISQGRLRDQIFQGNSKDYEGILYEDAGLILGSGENYVSEGLRNEDLLRIDDYFRSSPHSFGNLVYLPGNQFTLRRAFVTKPFAEGHETDQEALEEGYQLIKSNMKAFLPNAKVVKSADGVDILSQGACKSLPLSRYLNILSQRVQIVPEDVLVLGDAANDIGMLELILEKGGKAGFVGEDSVLISKMQEIGTYIPIVKGPLGTLETIKHYSL